MLAQIFLLSLLAAAVYIFMWWLLIIWYKDAKDKHIKQFREGIIFTKEQCREKISEDRTACIACMIAIVLFTLYGIEQFGHELNFIPQDFNLFGIVFCTLGIIGLLLMLCRWLGFPLFSMLLLVLLLPFGGFRSWRHRIP